MINPPEPKIYNANLDENTCVVSIEIEDGLPLADAVKAMYAAAIGLENVTIETDVVEVGNGPEGIISVVGRRQMTPPEREAEIARRRYDEAWREHVAIFRKAYDEGRI